MNLLTVKELAEILNVKTSTLYQWAELMQIPCIKLNGSLRFDMDDIEAWVRGCKKEPQTDYNELQTVTGSPRKGAKGRYGAI